MLSGTLLSFRHGPARHPNADATCAYATCVYATSHPTRFGQGGTGAGLGDYFGERMLLLDLMPVMHGATGVPVGVVIG